MKVYVTIERGYYISTITGHTGDSITGVYVSKEEADDAAKRWDYEVEEHELIRPGREDDSDRSEAQIP